MVHKFKHSGDISNKARDVNATRLSTDGFFTLLYPMILLKISLLILLKEPSKDRNAFSTSEQPTKYHAWSCHADLFIRFGTKLYRQVVEILMGTICAPLIADLFLFCYERDFMMSLSDDKQAAFIGAFNSTSKYVDDILNHN